MTHASRSKARNRLCVLGAPLSSDGQCGRIAYELKTIVKIPDRKLSCRKQRRGQGTYHSTPMLPPFAGVVLTYYVRRRREQCTLLRTRTRGFPVFFMYLRATFSRVFSAADQIIFGSELRDLYVQSLPRSMSKAALSEIKKLWSPVLVYKQGCLYLRGDGPSWKKSPAWVSSSYS